MLIEQPHFVHPVDVELAGTLRGPLADPADASHRDYVADARGWLAQYLIGEYNRAAATHPGRYTGHDEPVIRDLTEAPYTDADGRNWAVPHEAGRVTYNVGFIGTLAVHENPDWTE